MKETRKRKRVFSGGPITFFNNLRRHAENENAAVCEICREETAALLQCRECAFVFCTPCMLKLYNITGPTVASFSQCPDCTGTDLSSVIF